MPTLDGADSLLLAAGILGATVMPHVIYLHSALMQRRVVGRDEAERRKIFHFEMADILIAMGIAGLINGAMLVMAAGLFFDSTVVISTLEGAFAHLNTEAGSLAAILFGVGLLASGFSSSSVGTMSGQIIMSGYINRRIPLTLRRLITMAPALGVLALGVDPTTALVMSQVVLSFGIPFALIPLLIFCSDPTLMGSLVNRRITTWLAWAVAALIIALNVFLLTRILFG